MLETSARLLRLLSLLQTPREWTGTELADRLEVSTRTVRNDVDRLRQLGYPVHATRGAVGGYRLGAGANLPPLLLDDEEAVAVAVGLRSAAGGSIAGIEEISLRALAKLEQVLPTRLRRRVNALQTYTVAVPALRRGPTVDASLLTTLTAACRDHERVRFGYSDHSGADSVRVVEPYRLVNWGRRWYLLAYDIERHDWRIFRLDRVQPQSPTGQRFAPRPMPEPDAATYVARRVSTAPWKYTASVTFYAPAETIAERIPHQFGAVEAIDDHTCVFKTGASSVEELAMWLGYLGVDFTVTEPPELVAHLQKLSVRFGQSGQPRG
ncbi:DNA-binding transcriptional regulator [Rhizocola hellebori]|uniref:DNA-binding transcriptional regulator n=1 Tax=Rhizocola hellebori TaxID=1392758 RepID=A0A8J3VIE1_9ACTN|nr:YafY family protein [Rhizocola hellebori]GIH06838.1 DNA-binding transcriptional regulator [Rhizocola hellebori]